MRLLNSAPFPLRRPRTGLAALLLLFIALAVLLLTAGPAPAQAQAQPILGTPLVSNLEQSPQSTTSNNLDFGQLFNAGPGSNGHTLTGVSLKLLVTTATAPTYTVKIYTSNSDLPSTTVVGTLTKPSSLPTDTTSGLTADQIRDRLVEVHFEAPGDGISLNANTNYLVVFDVTAANNAQWYVGETSVDDDDPGAASDWWIKDNAIWRTHDGANWTNSPQSRQIAVHGYVNPTPEKLVGNTGQADGTTVSFFQDHAQAFKTGLHATGYKLTRLDLELTRGTGSQPTYSVSIHEDSSGRPGNRLGTLTNPSNLPSSWGTVQFTAPGGGIDLAAKTTYHVVVDVSSGNSNTRIRQTSSNAEDEDGIGGVHQEWIWPSTKPESRQAWEWSIADGGRQRAFTIGPWISSQTYKMALHGHPKLPEGSRSAVSSSASVNGRTLTILLGWPLQENQVPLGAAFPVTLSDFSFIPVSEVSIFGNSVTLTLDEPIASHVNGARVEYHPWKARGADTGKPLESKWYISPVPDDPRVPDHMVWYFDRDVTVLTPDTPPVVQELVVGHSERPENQRWVIATSLTVEDLPPVERWSKLAVVLNEPLNVSSLPAGSAFTVTARPPDGGSAVTVSGTGTVKSDGHNTIFMRLAEPVARDAELTVSYVKPSENWLRDRTGKDLESFSGVAATNVDRGMAVPEVVSVALSDPGSDRTYRWGETIRVQVTFSGDVLVFGTPRLRLSMGQSHPETSPTRGGAYRPYAEYESGSETRTLTFAYTVKELDSSGGIAVNDRLELNGGSIWSWAWPGWEKSNPRLSFPELGLSYNPDYKVDGQLPVLQRAAVTGSTLTMTFAPTVGSLNLDTESIPAPGDFYVTVNDARRNVADGGVAIDGNTVTLTLASEVTVGDAVKVRYTKPSANPLQSTLGIAALTFTDQAVANTAGETIWSASLGVVRSGVVAGCAALISACSGGLTSDSFSKGGTSYQIIEVIVGFPSGLSTTADSLHLKLDKAIPPDWTLHTGNDQFPVADATLSDNNKKAEWSVSGDLGQRLNWVNNSAVLLRLTAPPDSFQTIPPQGQGFALSTMGLPVSIAASPPSPRVGESVTLTAAITDAPAGSSPSYQWEIETNGEWTSFGTRPTLSFLAANPESWTFRVTVSYDTGESGTSPPLTVVWSDEEQTQAEAGPVGTSEDDPVPQAPTVTGVSVSSSPQANATYAKGETIQVALTFSEAVDVTGTPRLNIDMDSADGGEMWAGYASGSGTATLTFTHSVAEPNISTQGIAVLANTLELNGGDIESKESDTDADLAHTGLAHDSAHKVDWRLPLASVTGVSVTSDPGSDDTYANGDVITITLTFSKAVNVTGAPRLKIDMDPAEWGEKWAGYASGSGASSLTFTHTVVEPNISTQGIAVLANTLELNGGTIQSDGLAAQLAHTGLAHDADHKVDWQTGSDGEQSAAPTITGVEVTSDPSSGDTYGPGEVIRISVTFDEAVDVTGAPELTIDMDPAEWGSKQAAYESGSGTTTLVFAHTVVEPNISTQGIAVLANTLALNGGDIESASTDTDADLSHDGLAHDSDHKVDWRPQTPTVTGVEVTSDPSSGDTYGPGEVIRISVTFDEAVDVTGAPELTIDMDPAEWGSKQAAYESGSGTTTLVFAHTVVEPNISTQGIAVLANTLALNGGDIESKATDTDADLSHDGLAHDADHKVNWQQADDGPGS